MIGLCHSIDRYALFLTYFLLQEDLILIPKESQMQKLDDSANLS